ncbi:MAG: hypothetical protein ACK5Q5_24720 [Planctomycetaceae bacterium]
MEYHVRPLGKTCAGTGRPLEPGSQVISVLVEREGELQRLDYSAEGWPGAPTGTVGQWQSFVPKGEVSSIRTVDPDAMLAYFEQVLEDANPAQEQIAYVLALYLLQRRRLRLDGARNDDDGQFLQLAGSRGEGPYEVRDQQLSDEEIQRLQAEVHLAMQAEWNAA